MKNWKPWVWGFMIAVLIIGGWFLVWEGVALLNGVPGDTLSAKFIEAACISVDECTNPDAAQVKWGTLALLLGILSLTAWLIWHFYVEPVRYRAKHGKQIERS